MKYQSLFQYRSNLFIFSLLLIVLVPTTAEASWKFLSNGWTAKIKSALAPSRVNGSFNSLVNSDLVGLWSFNGPDMTDTTALDRSSQANTGTLEGMTTASAAIAGKSGQGINFDGVDDQITIANMDQYDTLSVSLWLKRGRTSNTVDDGLIGCSVNGGWGIGLVGDDAHALPEGSLFITQIGVSNATSDGTVFTDLEWHHLVVTYDGTDARFYVDGLLDATINYPGIDFDCASAGYGIGNVNGATWYQGILDEVRVYNRAITAGEVSRLYRMGK